MKFIILGISLLGLVILSAEINKGRIFQEMVRQNLHSPPPPPKTPQGGVGNAPPMIPEMEQCVRITPNLRILLSLPNGMASAMTSPKGGVNCVDFQSIYIPYITIDVLSLKEAGQNQEIANIGESLVTTKVWRKDKQELELLPTGAECTVSSLSCTVVELQNHLKALHYYTGRYPSDTYTLYWLDVRIEVSFSLYEFCFATYGNTTGANDCPYQLLKGVAPADIQGSLTAFDAMIQSLRVDDQP